MIPDIPLNTLSLSQVSPYNFHSSEARRLAELDGIYIPDVELLRVTGGLIHVDGEHRRQNQVQWTWCSEAENDSDES